VATKPVTPALLWFLDKHGFLSPEVAIRSLAKELVQRYSEQKAPFDPAQLAPYRQVSQILFEPMDREAMLIPTSEGFKIKVNSNLPRVRRRFGLAHEIGHTYFFDIEASKPFRPYPRTRGDLTEERLCDIFAEEILMPEKDFVTTARRFGEPSLGTFLRLARTYDVSTRCTAIRIQNLKVWNVAIISWQYRGLDKKDGKKHDPKMRVSWSAVPKGHFVPTGDSVDYDSIVHKCYQGNAQPSAATDKLSLGTIRGWHHIECQRINSAEGPAVISLIQLGSSHS
jgi:Zn-dependent peptidase ImmA (M78 family)